MAEKLGYTIEQEHFEKEIEDISATKIREDLNNLLHINYELDYEYLEKVVYTLPRKLFYYKKQLVEGYHYAPWEDKLLDEVRYIFNPKGRYNFKFIFLQPFTKLDWHTDKGTKSAVMWKLHGKDMLEFRDKSYHYDTAIVDHN